MTRSRPPFTCVKVLPSGRCRAIYRPRQAPHQSKTFDNREEALYWLATLREELEEKGEVSKVTGLRAYQRSGK